MQSKDKSFRAPYEFSKQTILEALQRCNFTCDVCGKHKKETPEGYLEAHHLVGIYFFLKYKKEFPGMTREIMRSVANCSMLCVECHKKAHSLDFVDQYKALQRYKTIAESILSASRHSQLAMMFIYHLANE